MPPLRVAAAVLAVALVTLSPARAAELAPQVAEYQLVTRYFKAAPPDDVSAWVLDAEVKRQLGHCDEALPQYDRVLAKIAEARGSRLGAAACHEQLGQKDAAKRDYEEFLKRYPKDDRAGEAKAGLARLK